MFEKYGNVWVVSDHHLGHKNILNFTDDNGNKIRPFTSLEEMHDVLLQNHNKVVKPNDYVIFGGDFAYDHQYAKWFLENMNGKATLILGNHDRIYDNNFKYLYFKHFKKIEMWKKFGNMNPPVIISHIPLKTTSLGESGNMFYNIHGHTHQNNENDSRYFNVSVENINYTPMNIEDVLEVFRSENKEFSK